MAKSDGNLSALLKLWSKNIWLPFLWTGYMYVCTYVCVKYIIIYLFKTHCKGDNHSSKMANIILPAVRSVTLNLANFSEVAK